MLKLYCLKENKKNYLKWVDKYQSMNTDEKYETLHNTTVRKFQRTWGGINIPKEEEEWIEAFDYFFEKEKEMMGDVHEMMGLPRNGIRLDNC